MNVQELSESSEALENRSVGLAVANKKLKTTASLFESRKSVPGPHYSMTLKAVQT